MVTLVGERNFCGNFEPAWLNVEFAGCTAAFQLLAWALLSGAALQHISGMINSAVCSTGVFLLCSAVPVGKSVLGTDPTGPEEGSQEGSGTAWKLLDLGGPQLNPEPTFPSSQQMLERSSVHS